MELIKWNDNEEYWKLTWLKFKDGDKEAFATFYNLHVDRLYHYGQTLCNDDDTVKDAIQEVFLDLYLKRAKNRTTHENLKYYLLLALKRNLIKKLKSKRRFEGEEISEDKFSELEFSPEYKLIEFENNEELRLKLSKALDDLPSKQKEAVYLRFNEAMEYPEIADILGITIESVRKQVYRALKTVRKLLDNKSITILFHFFQRKVKKAVHV
jgi:RNA polymerase sigma factor (sigma-70 family)